MVITNGVQNQMSKGKNTKQEQSKQKSLQKLKRGSGGDNEQCSNSEVQRKITKQEQSENGPL
jgi:hypothetical protein